MTRGPTVNRCSTIRSCCQVCQLDLTDMPVKEYFKLKKACPQHVSADEVSIPGKDCLHRFCHQCGKYEPLDCFDGNRRSCRTRLVKRRKPAAGSKPAAPDSSSANTQQQPYTFPASPDTQLSDTTPQLTASASAAAYSMSWGFNPAAASAAASWSGWDGCAEDTTDFCELDAQLQQLFQDQLGGCSVPSIDLPACQLPQLHVQYDQYDQHTQQQQQGFMGMLAEGAGEASAAASSPAAAGDDFVDLLAAAMQDELQQCLEEQQQQQAVQLQHSSMGAQTVLMPAGYATPAPLSADFRTCSMPSTCTNVLLQDNSAAAVTAAAPSVSAMPVMDSEPWSDNSSASSTLPMLDVYSGFAAAQAAMPPAPAAASAGGCGVLPAGCATADDLLRMQRMAQLRAELEGLERRAATVLPGMQAMQSCTSAMPAHMVPAHAGQQLGGYGGASFGAVGVDSTAVMHHAQLVPQQSGAAMNQRLQQLHSQVVQMSSQLDHLRAMMSAGQGRPAMAESFHAGSMCFGRV